MSSKLQLYLIGIIIVLIVFVGVCECTIQRPAATPREYLVQQSQEEAAVAPPPPTPTPDWVKLPPFPPQFTADYHRFESYFSVINSTGVIYQDEPNQKCRMSSKPTDPNNFYYAIEQLAFYRPPNAQPNTAPASLLTLFNYGPYGVDDTPFPAIYSVRTAETEYQSIYPFPSYWFSYGGKPTIYSFWQVPYYMWFNGTTTINGVQGLRYISTNTCAMGRPIGTIPCNTYIIAADTGYPLQTIDAIPRRPNSFESDHYIQYTFSNFKLGPPDSSAFDLPSNWTSVYRNYNNGINIERQPGTSYSVVTPGQPLSMTMHLTTVPVQSLGAVTVQVVPAPDASYNCTNCISYSPTSFTFTTEDWHTPQKLTITYLKDGAQKLNVTFSGGGYDYLRPYNDPSYYLSIIACEGVTGIKCNSWGV